MAIHAGHSRAFVRIRTGLALAAAGVLLAACGSSSKGATGSVGSASSAPSTAASSSSSKGTGGVNLGGGSFCDKIKTAVADESNALSTSSLSNPSSLKDLETKANAALQQLKDSAPAEIKGAVNLVAGAEEQIFTQLSNSNFDFTKVGPQLQGTFTSPQFLQATKQIETYLATKCGINPSAFPTS